MFKPQKEGPAPTTEEQQIVRDQDDEYRAACEEATRNGIHANSDLHFQENEAMIAEEEKNNKEGEVMRLYYQLPAEPAAGTTIATMLNGERLMRKFGLDEMASAILNGGSYHVNPDFMLHVTEILCKIQHSAVNGTAETIESRL